MNERVQSLGKVSFPSLLYFPLSLPSPSSQVNRRQPNQRRLPFLLVECLSANPGGGDRGAGQDAREGQSGEWSGR